jgi:hypothetical protein
MLDTLWGPWVALLGIVACLGIGMFGLSSLSGLIQAKDRNSSACNIKGNISFSGEKIYHLPGQKYFSRTVINPLKGERWFCSEADARAAGWRRSRV